MTNIFDDHLPPLPKPDESKQPQRTRSNKRQVEKPSSLFLKKGAIRLEDMVGMAFDTIQEAMQFADYSVAVQASKLVLDRSGFGPSSTLRVEDATDLSNLSTEELALLAIKLSQCLSNNNSSESSDSNPSPSTAVH